MPELPDVEVFTRNLDKLFAGKKMERIKVVNGDKLQDSAAALSKALNGKTLEKIHRSGKEMRFHFSGDTLLGLHLMLTGDIFVFDQENEKKSTIVELHFAGGQGLALTDRMRNANVKLNPIDKEGVDAISPELNFKYLQHALKRRTNVKNVLTDQHTIRGIGNSYSDEILWDARISPYSVAQAIPDEKIKDLLTSIKKILKAEIRNIYKNHKGITHGEVKDYMKIHTKDRKTSPTGAAIQTTAKGMMKTYYTDEQVLYK